MMQLKEERTMVCKLSNQVYAISKTIIKPDKEFSFVAYVVKGDINVLIDTLPERSADLLISDLKEILQEENLNVLILNHSEEDQSGALESVLNQYPDIHIYCTKECQHRLDNRIAGKKCSVVNSMEEINLGEHSFQFVKTPGLHWDDNMVTFYKEEQILFSNDLFGQTAACEPPMDYLYDDNKFLEALEAYCARVFSESTAAQRENAMEVLYLPIRLIAPGHGIVIDTQLGTVLDFYKKKFKE